MFKFFCVILLDLVMVLFGSPAQSQEVFTDARDGHTYQTIRIGEKIWMAENLAYLPRVDEIRDLSWDESRYWVYDYRGVRADEARETEHYQTFGVLYNWPAAVKDACPDGWHIPDEADWRDLELSLGMAENELHLRGWRESGSVGKKLKTVSGWYVNTGTNESGFNALPGGLLGYNAFEAETFVGYFWVGTATHKDNAWIRSIVFSKDGIQRLEERKWFGCYVRCVKNQ